MREERKTVRGLLESIDTETILKEGCIPAGGRGSGKSTLGMWIVRKLRMDGVSFKIIDISLVWSWCSPMFFPAFRGDEDMTAHEARNDEERDVVFNLSLDR